MIELKGIYPMPHTATLAFGPLLKHLRKQAGMTQRDLAAALGYSESLVCNLEKAQRQPDLQAVTERFIPALGLQDDPQTAAHLIEQAALARGERPPASVTFQRTIQLSVQDEHGQAQLAEPIHALPSPPTELIGRAAAINQLCKRLLGHGGRLLTLLGPPGIGKTTLALAVAAQLQNHYQDGAVFVPLAAVSDPTLMAATILAAVGSTDLNPPQNKLITFLRRKTMLLVLDNLEQIRDAAALIAALVAACPGLCILATSRERLHLRAEQRYKVPPLDLAAAVELFVQRAQAIDADFDLTPHNQPTLAAICQRLDCLPLAIELCAAQTDLLAPAQLLAQLQDHRLDLLVDGAHDLPPRQRTLRTAIGYSYQLLDEAERTLFRTLGSFVGGFALDAAVALATDRLEPVAVQPTLHALISKSLVHAVTLPGGEQRFLLLETIREFALEQARTQGEESLLRQRHYAVYLQLFRTGDSHLRRAEAATWLARLQPEQDNLRAALQWTINEGCYADAVWLLIAAGWFWNLCGNRYEKGRWIAQLLPYRDQLDVDLRLEILGSLHSVAGAWDEFQPVARWKDEMLQLVPASSHKLIQAATWFWLAISAADVTQAAAWEQAIHLARDAGEEPALGAEFGLVADRDFVLVSCLCDYASRLIERGEIARAAPLLTESLDIFRRRENHYEIADGLGTLGLLALLQGDLIQAHSYLHEAVSIATAIHQEILANWQPLLGLVTLYAGDTAAAHRLLHESLHLCVEMKYKDKLARVCTYLAETALWEGDLEQAAHWLAQSLAHDADPHKITIYEVMRLFVAARLATAQQIYERAATLFGLANQMHGEIKYAIGGPMCALADAALATVRAALATVRAALEPAVFAEAFAGGQQMSLAEAFATILIPSQGLGK